jgi:hypothetical protein
MLEPHTCDTLVQLQVWNEAVDMSVGIAIGTDTNERYVRRQLPKMKVWCGYARIVIFTERRGRNEGR